MILVYLMTVSLLSYPLHLKILLYLIIIIFLVEDFCSKDQDKLEISEEIAEKLGDINLRKGKFYDTNLSIILIILEIIYIKAFVLDIRVSSEESRKSHDYLHPPSS